MRFRLRLVALFLACAFLINLYAPYPRPHPEVSSMGVERDWSGLVVAKQQQDAWYSGVATAAAKRPSEGNGAAMAQQAARQGVSYDGIEGVICSVFVDNCAAAIRVARCESGLNPNARNASGAAGLFQLLGHSTLYEAHGWTLADWADPYVNTVVAHDLWESSGWSPWVCAA